MNNMDELMNKSGSDAGGAGKGTDLDSVIAKLKEVLSDLESINGDESQEPDEQGAGDHGLAILIGHPKGATK